MEEQLQRKWARAKSDPRTDPKKSVFLDVPLGIPARQLLRCNTGVKGICIITQLDEISAARRMLARGISALSMQDYASALAKSSLAVDISRPIDTVKVRLAERIPWLACDVLLTIEDGIATTMDMCTQGPIPEQFLRRHYGAQPTKLSSGDAVMEWIVSGLHIFYENPTFSTKIVYDPFFSRYIDGVTQVPDTAI